MKLLDEADPSSGVEANYAGYHATHQRPLWVDDEYYLARAESALRYFHGLDTNGLTLDWGCGLGATIFRLPNAWGYDPAPEARQRARERGIRVYDHPGEIPRRSFDIVICRHVLEHVEDPLVTLHRLASHLTVDGTLILVLPIEPWYPLPRGRDENQHLYCWTPRTIGNLLYRAGLHPQSCETSYPFGARRLLPLYRIHPFLYHLAQDLGQMLRRNGEMIIRARTHERDQ